MKPWLLFSKLALVSSCLYCLPLISFAQSVDGQSVSIDGDNPEEFITEVSYTLEQPFGGTGTVSSLGDYIQLVYQFALGIVGIIAVVLIMFGGLRWTAAAGNESIIGEAKEIIVSAITGLAIALLSYMILAFINPQLLSTDLSVLKIPLPSEESSMAACSTDSQLTEDSSARYCNGMGSGTVSSVDLNSWIMKYGSGVSPTFIKAIFKTESAFCIDARSNIADSEGVRHACGLAQAMPTTAAGFASACGLSACSGVTSDYESDAAATACCNALRTNPEAAVCVGAKLLSSLKSNSYTKGDEALMAAAYNGGTCNSSETNGALCPSSGCPGQLMYQCEKNSGYAETRNYVDKVTSNKKQICVDNTGAGGCTTNSTSGSADNSYCTNISSGAVYYTGATCTNGVPSCSTTPGVISSVTSLATCGKTSSTNPNTHFEFTSGIQAPTCVAD